MFICPPKDQGWILYGVANEIQKRVRTKNKIIYLGENLPSAKNYIFMHYVFYYYYLNNCTIQCSKNIIYLTHFEEQKHNFSNSKAIKLLNTCDLVICMNTNLESYIENNGLITKRSVTIIGGADPDIFFEKKNAKKEYIGFSTAFYSRKSPDKILNTIKRMPEYNFILLGKGWDKYDRFNELISQKNFVYKDIHYKEYADYYNKMKVFVSLSELEGGPIPLIESMMCNAIPVVTDTGFARDVINEGINGFIIPVDSNEDLIIKSIRNASQININISKSVQNLCWDNFALEILSFIES